jgi:hypothetical protein
VSDDVKFDEFVDAIQKVGAGDQDDGTEVVQGSESIPLTHSSGVTPKDWERVQQQLHERG